MCTLPQLLYQRLSVHLYSYDKILNGLDKALNVFSARLEEMVLLTSTLHLPLYNLLGLIIQNIVKINKHISYHIIYFKIE